MIGAIAEDIIGSRFERLPLKTTQFHLFDPSCRFTDDTVLTVALADSLLHGTPYVELLKRYYSNYPNAGYGGSFHRWALSEQSEPYHSWGNGSAMRVSPVGFASGTLEEVLDRAERSAEVTHDHPEGIKGAQAVASAVVLARTGQTKEQIRNCVETTFGYKLSIPLDEIRPRCSFEVSCRHSVSQAIRAFLESDDYETAVRLAVSLGGDSDTLACMAGGVAQAFYGGIPEEIRRWAFEFLDEPLVEVVHKFAEAFGCP